MSLITVIIPSFNRCVLLQRALTSVLQQTYSPIEIIVIDDGSTDGTRNMLQQHFPAVTYFYQSNQGVSSARNKAIDLAKAQWIAFLDSDDEWLPSKLQKQVDLLTKNPDYKVCHTEEQWVRNGIKVNQMKKHQKKGGWIFSQCLPLCAMSPSSIIIHRSIFSTLGDFDTSLPACEDYDLWLRITAQYPVLYIKEPQIIKYGGHDDQLSRQYWGMDQYRIIALQKIILGGTLNKEDQQEAILTLLKKCKIFKQGALKRGKDESAQHYQKIIAQFSTSASQS